MFEYDDYLGMSGSIFLVIAYFCTTYKTYNNIAKEGIDQLENYGFKRTNPILMLC